MKWRLSLLAILLSNLLFAQEITIKFKPAFGLLPLELNKTYSYKNDSVQITALKFYVSDIKFYQDERPVNIAVKKYHLVNVDSKKTLEIKSNNNNKQTFNRIQLHIGVDSLTNVSGAHGNDLDPSNGMYWTWQSGYINFKLEGKSKICPSRNNEFIFHIGGYQYPNNTMQQLTFNITNKKLIVINVDIAQLLNQVKLNEFFHLMSPGKKAVVMAQKIAGIFKAGI